MLMTRLEVINACLATMGESPVNDPNSDMPFVVAASSRLDETNRSMQARGWWFNKEIVKLNPQADTKQVYLPADFMSFQHPVMPPWVSQRGNRIYDNRRGEFYTTDAAQVPVAIIRLLPFEDLPYNACNYIKALTVRAFQIDYNADPLKDRRAALAELDAMAEVNAEHTRAVCANVFTAGSVGEALVSTHWATSGPGGNIFII